jgi:2-polyprenyl-3-methyl-5-hydroxy-6-metoxy-1,4-benzoquinol methylase
MFKKVGFSDFISMGRPQMHGQTSLAKALFFSLFGSPDAHTRIRNSHVLNVIEALDLPPTTQVLDLGCGRAIALFWLAKHHPDWQLTGVELDPALASSAKRAVERGGWSNIQIIEGTVMDIKDEGSYDLAICIDVLEHVPDDVGLLKKARQALKPGGYVVLHVPRRNEQQWRLLKVFHQHRVEGEYGHVRDEYTEDELRERFLAAGFEIRELRQTFGRWGEISFELNQIGWQRPWLRYTLVPFTYPFAMPIGYLDTRQYQEYGNAYLVIAQKP